MQCIDVYVCVWGRTYYFNWKEAHKKKSFWDWLKLWVHLNMLVVLYEEISNVSHMLQMFKNGLRMSFCLPETYNYLKNIFLQQHWYLFLCASFAVLMLNLSFHIAVKKVKKPKPLIKLTTESGFKTISHDSNFFLSESFFLEQLTYHYCFPCFRILASQNCPIHSWTKKNPCLQKSGFFFSNYNVLFPFPSPLLC